MPSKVLLAFVYYRGYFVVVILAFIGVSIHQVEGLLLILGRSCLARLSRSQAAWSHGGLRHICEDSIAAHARVEAACWSFVSVLWWRFCSARVEDWWLLQ